MLQQILLYIVVALMCAAIVWIAFRVYKQWHKPQKQYQAQLDDIQRRKRELGIMDDDEKN